MVDIISNNKEEMLYLLASLESKSEHPLAKSIMKYCNITDLADVKDFKMHIGKGVTGTVHDSKIMAGNKKLLKSEKIPIKDSKENKKG